MADDLCRKCTQHSSFSVPLHDIASFNTQFSWMSGPYNFIQVEKLRDQRHNRAVPSAYYISKSRARGQDCIQRNET
jgi:hypothetical protein